ncbi:hypothetical protein GDO86_020235 [Hymenochirus boettgeri]|uniref:Uncharacterized protein n=1 Tax=Hymenochirus boettgeri TaxID=247094 RepID=A0A8T2IC82_9PIPI|nr:hypothetical protein GDO86_020235 [Hymenochirus boettgeri]
MFLYKVEITTGKQLLAGTMDDIYAALIGSYGETTKQRLDNIGFDFLPGSVREYEISSDIDLGTIQLIRLYKERFLLFPEDAWFCNSIKVTCPNGDFYEFPFYQWLSHFGTIEIQQGKGIIMSQNISPIIKKHRESELEGKRITHSWKTYAHGSPHCINVDSVIDLPPNDQFSFMKTVSFGYDFLSSDIGIKLKGYMDCKETWKDLNDIRRVFCLKRTANSDLVAELWKKDSFFGYQYLNGVNPVMIKKCRLPENFPVDHGAVSLLLSPSTSLENEMQNGNIFIADYKILEGIPTNVINGEKQYLAAPLCLLWKSPDDEILPIAIQINQTPGEKNPIFLPSDPEWDWTLAKTWVRNAEFQVHEVITHLLHTHLFAEVFNMATTRNLPMGHPIYKLIIPHLRFTLEINTLARKQLIGPGGLFDQAVATGNGGVPVLLSKAMEILTYSALCLPDDIEDRGLQSVPNYYYRDDGMKIWKAIQRYVSDIVHYYYESDEAVVNDSELQVWVAEIFQEGFLSNKKTGIPSSFATRVEMTKYLTMAIFTCSAQHAAVNSGQFDFFAWMPNGPTTMRKPPPTIKGTATEQSFLETLPAVNTTAIGMGTVALLSTEPLDRRPLGSYHNPYFTEDTPKKFVKQFREKMAEISKHIKLRNETMKLTYSYLDPEFIESSVSI